MSTTDLPPPPNSVTPELVHVDAADLDSWHDAIARGFQETVRDDERELYRRLTEVERSFGFQVEGRWVATFGAFTRRLGVPGGADLEHAAISEVTVHSPYRRRGLLGQMMRHQLEDCVRRGEPVATLWASESLIYGRFGFGQAVTRHLLSGRSRELRFLPEVALAGSVGELTREQFLALARKLHPGLRAERPGTFSRDSETGWEMSTVDSEGARAGASPLRYLAHFAEDGEPDGIATYRFKEGEDGPSPDGEVRVHELWAEQPTAYASLWRYLLDIDLARRFRYRNAAPDEPLRHLVADHRQVTTELTDGLYLRVIDLPAALQARAYAAPVDVVLEVTDDLLPTNAGRWRLRSEGDPGTTRVERTEDPADIALDVRELGTVYLGGTTLRELHRAGRVTELAPGAVDTTAAALTWPRSPWCPDFF